MDQQRAAAFRTCAKLISVVSDVYMLYTASKIPVLHTINMRCGCL